MRALLVTLLLALGLGLLAGGPAGSASPDLRDGALVLPEGELASDVWTVAARFASGHLLLVEVGVTNAGLGDRNGALVGHLVEPDGTTHRFQKARREGRWSLAADGRRIEVGPLLLDRSAEPPRLRLERDAFRVDLRFAGAPGPATPVALGLPRQEIEVVHLATPIRGTLWTEAGGEQAVQGSLALVRRHTETLESQVASRRVEFFSLGDDPEVTSLYAVEVAGDPAEARRWMVVGRGERVLWSGPVQSRLAWEERGGFALPTALRFDAPHLRTQVDLGPVLLRDEPLRDLPMPVRVALAPFIDWREAWSRASFELRRLGEGGAHSFERSGRGVVRVSYFKEHAPPRAAGAASGAR